MSIFHFSDFFEFKSFQQCWINLVCQTQIINRSQISQGQACQIQQKKNVSWNYEAATKFFFSLSILLSQFKQCKLYFPVYLTPFSSMSTFACVIWCSRPPNSERDITDTQSRYANRKSYITSNCHRAFQIWRKTDIDKKASFTHVKITPLLVLRYFMLCPLVFGIPSFLLVSVFFFYISIELVTKRNRYICVSICLMFQMIDTVSDPC